MSFLQYMHHLDSCGKLLHNSPFSSPEGTSRHVKNASFFHTLSCTGFKELGAFSVLKNLLLSLNYKDKLRFQNQYSECTNSSPGEEAELGSQRLFSGEAFCPSCGTGQPQP